MNSVPKNNGIIWMELKNRGVIDELIKPTYCHVFRFDKNKAILTFP